MLYLEEKRVLILTTSDLVSTAHEKSVEEIKICSLIRSEAFRALCFSDIAILVHKGKMKIVKCKYQEPKVGLILDELGIVLNDETQEKKDG